MSFGQMSHSFKTKAREHNVCSLYPTVVGIPRPPNSAWGLPELHSAMHRRPCGAGNQTQVRYILAMHSNLCTINPVHITIYILFTCLFSNHTGSAQGTLPACFGMLCVAMNWIEYGTGSTTCKYFSPVLSLWPTISQSTFFCGLFCLLTLVTDNVN